MRAATVAKPLTVTEPFLYRTVSTTGTLRVGAEVAGEGNHWLVKKVMMSRSARRLMEGWVRVPPA